MKTINYLVSLLLFAAILVGCGEDPKDNPVLQEAFKIHNEAMAIHDEIMPQMKDLDDLEDQVEQAMNQMQIASVPMDTAQFQALQAAEEALDAADESMRDWMANLSEVPGFAHEHNHGDHDHDDHDHGDHDDHDDHDHGDHDDHDHAGHDHDHDHHHGADPKLTPEQILEVQKTHKADIIKIKEQMEAAMTGAQQLLAAVVAPAEAAPAEGEEQ